MKKNKKLKELVQKMADVSFKDGKLLDLKARNYLKDIKKLPTSESIYILSEYLKALKIMKLQTTLIIESATPLSPTQISQIKSELRKDFKFSEVETVINPELIGGIRIRIGDNLYDDSVLAKIIQIGEAIRS